MLDWLRKCRKSGTHMLCAHVALTAISAAGTACGSGQIRSSKRQRDRGHISRAKQGTLQKPAALCQNLPLEFFSCLIRAVRIPHCWSPIFRAEALKLSGCMLLGTPKYWSVLCSKAIKKLLQNERNAFNVLVGLHTRFLSTKVKVFPPGTD